MFATFILCLDLNYLYLSRKSVIILTLDAIEEKINSESTYYSLFFFSVFIYIAICISIVKLISLAKP